MMTRISGEALRAAQLYAQNTTQTHRKNAEQVASKGLPADKVDLSPQARELVAAMRAFREAEVVGAEEREARLAELAKQIQAGTYRPDSRQIAARLEPALRGLIIEES